MKPLPSKYDPHKIEEEIYASWDEAGLFSAKEGSGGKPYSIVIPPPNVTGILHMGHALNNTLQDILIRWKRMQGSESLWLPGTDHAGIATQNVVERQLSKEGKKRQEIGRDKFLEKVWEWKEDHGSTIIKQLKRLGCSCDWQRTRFTMDQGLSDAVKEVFIRLYEDRLLYKGDYIINWCPRCSTALSDEEAEHRETQGFLYYVKYPVKGKAVLEQENEDYVVVATTRPETMLGDVAVAVNPKDPRYEGLKGKTLLLPILNRELQVVFDEQVDPAFGTGALKVTPAHDPVDFELGNKHGLKRVNVMRQDATINELGAEYEGMDRFECREAIIEELKQRKLFVRAEEHDHSVGHCYRCHTVVEPRLSKQWFVKMKPLAEEAIKVVDEGRVTFYPDRWTKVYLNWMENIRDWCISRQIWWGHRIPVWYCKDCIGSGNVREVDISDHGQKGVTVSRETPERCPDCGGTDLEQDPDVLDTWFSSWLWPFSTMGWPEKTKDLDFFYPTNALVTAQEIIFFWVARMIMAGLKFMGDIPFSDVYIHGTVRDATGTKMSKSLGNVIDPIDVIDEVGSDALRFSIISITSQGQDVFLSKDKFDLGRNFSNKLWNASRYVLMSVGGGSPGGQIDTEALTLADRWILSEFNEARVKVDRSLGAYRFNDAASALYEFIWHKYCDWYLEISKFSENKENTGKVLVHVLKGALGLLHPFMPFITEAIWQKIPGDDGKWIMNSSWPETKDLDFSGAIQDMEKLTGIVTSVRNTRAFWNIPYSTGIEVLLAVKDTKDVALINGNLSVVERLAKCIVKSVGADTFRPEQSVASLVGDIKVFIPLGSSIDLEKERTKIEKKAEELQRFLGGLSKKLENKAFLDKAPEEVVDKERRKQEKFQAELRNLEENLCALK